MYTKNFVFQNARQLCLTMKSLILNSYSFVYFKKFLSIDQLKLTGKAFSLKRYSKSNKATAVDYLNTAVSNTDFHLFLNIIRWRGTARKNPFG